MNQFNLTWISSALKAPACKNQLQLMIIICNVPESRRLQTTTNYVEWKVGDEIDTSSLSGCNLSPFLLNSSRFFFIIGCEVKCSYFIVALRLTHFISFTVLFISSEFCIQFRLSDKIFMGGKSNASAQAHTQPRYEANAVWMITNLI